MNPIERFCKFSLLLIVLGISCSKNQNMVILQEIDNDKLQTLQKGALINNVKEGYWITLTQDKVIIIEAYYVHGKLNGPIKYYTDEGRLMTESVMVNGKQNGTCVFYHSNGNIKAKGSFKNDEKDGLWEFYSFDGRIDRKMNYKNGEGEVLLDNHLSIPPPTPAD
jgi:antitoxin component YwqK of YwqJK toxin-antitoxin module